MSEHGADTTTPSLDGSAEQRPRGLAGVRQLHLWAWIERFDLPHPAWVEVEPGPDATAVVLAEDDTQLDALRWWVDRLPQVSLTAQSAGGRLAVRASGRLAGTSERWWFRVEVRATFAASHLMPFPARPVSVPEVHALLSPLTVDGPPVCGEPGHGDRAAVAVFRVHGSQRLGYLCEACARCSTLGGCDKPGTVRDRHGECWCAWHGVGVRGPEVVRIGSDRYRELQLADEAGVAPDPAAAAEAAAGDIEQRVVGEPPASGPPDDQHDEPAAAARVGSDAAGGPR